MDYESDDDIELLRASTCESNQRPDSGLDDVDSNLNPILLLRQESNPDDSIPAATVHALQISCSSLQNQLKLQQKQNKVLAQENKQFKKILKEYEATEGLTGESRVLGGMDYRNGMESAHAAGGTSEDDFLAEQRANEGLIRHLQKEVLLRDNALTRTKDEVYRLQYNCGELEKQLSSCLREKEKLQSDRDFMMGSYSGLNQDLQIQVKTMQEKLKVEQEKNAGLSEELKLTKHQLELLQRSSQEDIGKLRSQVNQYEKERRALLTQQQAEYQSLKREKETLEAQIKQLKIESEIAGQVRDSLNKREEADDVDGDISTLNAALEIVKQQKDDYAELKKKVADQATVIKELTSRGSSHVSEPRSEAQGSSINNVYIEEPHAGYIDMSASIMASQSSGVHIVNGPRRPSEQDYYAPRWPGPRIDDAVKPTGTQGITKMVAQVSHTGARRESASPALSPRPFQESEVQDVRAPEYRYENCPVPSPRIQHPAASTHYVTTANSAIKSPSPVRRSTEVAMNGDNVSDALNTRQRQVMTSTENIDVYNGARPRTYGNSNAMMPKVAVVAHPSSPRNQIPMRMTQSEILTREQSPNPLTPSMTRSITGSYDFVEDLANVQDSSVKRNEMDNRNTRIAVECTDRDYENVFDNRRQTEVKRPIDEHDETTALEHNLQVRENSFIAHPELGNNVSALKICPACNLECSRMSTEQFQMHIIDCFDNAEEAPVTLQPAVGNDDDRTCPMCNEVFPMAVPQETYEKHVLAHFGEEPDMDRFEFVQN